MTNPTPTDVNTLIERLDLHTSWRDSHGELNDAPNEAAQALRAMQARVGALEEALAPFARIPEIPASVPGIEITDDHYVNCEVPYAPHEQKSARAARNHHGERPLALNVSLDGLQVGHFRRARSTQQEAQRHGE